jgi:hypothetical protein
MLPPVLLAKAGWQPGVAKKESRVLDSALRGGGQPEKFRPANETGRHTRIELAVSWL